MSTSTSSFEALDPHDPNLSRLATSMFSKTADYLYGELTATLEDYRLLENMNKATVLKYTDMKQVAVNISKNMVELNEQCEGFISFWVKFYFCCSFVDDVLLPYLEQIDQIEDSVIKLEQAAYKLDAYTKRLEAKFKSLEKR